MPEDFDTILDRCLTDIAAGRETIDSCLRRYPAQAGRLAAVLELAERVQAAAPVPPLPADKRRVLEGRLLKRAAQLQAKPISHATVPRPTLQRRSLALALASVIAVALLLGTAVNVSAGSVPGDFLYPVKRMTEQVRSAFTPDVQQAELHLEFARQRFQELEILQERGEVSEPLLAEVSSETTQVLNRVSALPPDEQHSVLISLTDFQDQQFKLLSVMAAAAQGEAQTAVMNALADSVSRQNQAKALLAGAVSKPTPVINPTQGPVPTIFLETQPPPGKPTLKPTATDKPKPQATAKATKVSPASTPKAERTPPGQVNQPTPKPTKEPKPTKAPK